MELLLNPQYQVLPHIAELFSYLRILPGVGRSNVSQQIWLLHCIPIIKAFSTPWEFFYCLNRWPVTFSDFVQIHDLVGSRLMSNH